MSTPSGREMTSTSDGRENNCSIPPPRGNVKATTLLPVGALSLEEAILSAVRSNDGPPYGKDKTSPAISLYGAIRYRGDGEGCVDGGGLDDDGEIAEDLYREILEGLIIRRLEGAMVTAKGRKASEVKNVVAETSGEAASGGSAARRCGSSSVDGLLLRLASLASRSSLGDRCSDYVNIGSGSGSRRGHRMEDKNTRTTTATAAGATSTATATATATATCALYGMCLRLCRNAGAPLGGEEVSHILPVVLDAAFSSASVSPDSAAVDSKEGAVGLEMSRDLSWEEERVVLPAAAGPKATNDDDDDQCLWNEVVKTVALSAAISLGSVSKSLRPRCRPRVNRDRCPRSPSVKDDCSPPLTPATAADLGEVSLSNPRLLELAGCAALRAVALSVYGGGRGGGTSAAKLAARREFVSCGGLEGMLLLSSGRSVLDAEGGGGGRGLKKKKRPFSEGAKNNGVDDARSAAPDAALTSSFRRWHNLLCRFSSDLLDFVPGGDFLRLSSLRRHWRGGTSTRGDCLLAIMRGVTEPGIFQNRMIAAALRKRVVVAKMNDGEVPRTKIKSNKWQGPKGTGCDLIARLDSVQGEEGIGVREVKSTGRLSKSSDYSRDEFRRTKDRAEVLRKQETITGLLKEIDLGALDSPRFLDLFVERGLNWDSKVEELSEGDVSGLVESELQRRDRLIREAQLRDEALEEAAQKRIQEEHRRLQRREREERKAAAHKYSKRVRQEAKWNRWALAHKGRLVKDDVKKRMQEEKSVRRRETSFRKIMLREQMEETERETERVRQDASRTEVDKAEKEKQAQRRVALETEAMSHEDRRERERTAKEKQKKEFLKRAQQLEEGRRQEKWDRFQQEKDLLARRLNHGSWLKQEGLTYYKDSEVIEVIEEPDAAC